MTKTQHRLYVGSFIVVGIASFVLLLANGIGYYFLPIEYRPDHALHTQLKPTGLLGHGLGIIGSAMMIIGVAVYMLRKRLPRVFTWGYITHWLELHIFLCSVGPVLVLFHTAFKFGGIVAISFWSMTAVVLSGVIGRYIYVQIPHSIDGLELTPEAIDELQNSSAVSHPLTDSIINKYTEEVKEFFSHITGKDLSFFSLLTALYKSGKISSGIRKRLLTELRAVKELSSEENKNILNSFKEKLGLIRKRAFLRTMQRFFRYWHVFHLPFAITMFIIMIVHIVVTVSLGYIWIFEK